MENLRISLCVVGLVALAALGSLCYATVSGSAPSHGSGQPQTEQYKPFKNWPESNDDPEESDSGALSYEWEVGPSDYDGFGGKLTMEAANADIVADGWVQDATMKMKDVKGAVKSSDSVEVTCTGEPDEWAIVQCVNDIEFKYEYSWEDGGYHKFDLTAIAVNILGVQVVHAYQREITGQTTTEETDEESWEAAGEIEGGVEREGSVGTGGINARSAASARAKASAKAGGTTTRTTTQEGTTAGNFSSPASEEDQKKEALKYQFSDFQWGPCTFTAHWDFKSDMRIKLVAKAYTGSIVCDTSLDHYSVHNDVKTSWAVLSIPPMPPPSTPPGPDGTYSGSTPPTTPGNWSDPQELDSRALSWNLPTDAAYTVNATTGIGYRLMMNNGVGLATEQGRLRGSITLRCEEEASTDQVFSLSTTPGGMTDLPATVTIEAGRLSRFVAFEALSPESYNLTATLLDSNSQPTGTVLNVSATNTSSDSLSEPVISVVLTDQDVMGDQPSLIGDPEDFDRFIGGCGMQVGDLLIGRTAFAGWETTATTVSLVTQDPNGVLAALPTSVTIPAGELTVRLAMDLGATPGTATLTVNPGDDEWEGTIEAQQQAMSLSAEDIIVPMNGTALVAAKLAVEDEIVRWATPGSDDAQIAECSAVIESSNDIEWTIGNRMRLVRVTPLSVGTTSISVSAVGLTTATADVEVVATEVELGRTSLELSNLDGAEAGHIVLALPEGTTFASVTIPTVAASYLSTSSTGEQSIELVFEEGITRPSTLTVPITLLNAPTDEFGATVNDQLHGARKHTYQILVPEAP